MSDSELQFVADDLIESGSAAASASPQDAKKFFIISSNRGGHQLCIDGFIYNKNKYAKEKTYWECILRKRNKNSSSYCSAKAITTEPNGKLTIIKFTDHCHAPNTEEPHVKKARSEIKIAAKQTELKPCQIMQEQQASDGPAAICLAPSMPSKNASRKIIGRVRQAGKLKEPTSIDDIDIPHELRSTLSGQKFLQADMDVGDEKVLLFTTVEDLKNLEKCEFWMADGTFKTAPNLFLQLFTIHGCVGGINGTVVPLVYVLMTSKSRECYDEVMRCLTTAAVENNIVLNPKYVLTDFEMASMKAFAGEYPNSQSKGCLFHLGQSIYRRIQRNGHAKKYGNDVEFSQKLRQILALAFLPADQIPKAFDGLKSKFPPETEDLLRWFEETYIAGKKRKRSNNIDVRTEALFPPKIWSVYDSVLENIPRTQNIVESWHNRWLHLVGPHAGVYALIEQFRKEENQVRCKIERALAGILEPICKEQQKRNENIKRLLLERSNLSTDEFLKGMAYNLKF